ncbi:hypothetical protein ACQP3C_30340 [Escherichia coli]
MRSYRIVIGKGEGGEGREGKGEEERKRKRGKRKEGKPIFLLYSKPI